MSETLIREYYASFNERRFADAAALFTKDAILELIPFHEQQRGGAGYVAFAKAWVGAFPDGLLTIQRIDARGNGVFEVDLLATGTHFGTLKLGGAFLTFKPTGATARLRVRELLEIQAEKITLATLSFDLQEFVGQLGTVDYAKLMTRLGQIIRLTEELIHVQEHAARRRDVVERLGVELDAARTALRPYFSR